MVCKNLELRPKSKTIRTLIGNLDRCKYLKGVKNVTITMFSKQLCPFEKICKHYNIK